MTLKEYVKYIKLKFKSDIEVDVRLWKKFGAIVFKCNDVFFRDTHGIIKSIKDVDKVVELIKYQEKTGSNVFRVMNKLFTYTWKDCEIYNTTDIEVDFFDIGRSCSTVSNKTVLVKDNKVKGFFKYNKFYAASEVEDTQHFDKPLVAHSFKEISNERMEEEYPGLLQTFKNRSEEVFEDGLSYYF